MTYCRLIHVQDTDATGMLYFANLLQIGLETFEHWLYDQNFSIGEMVDQGKILLPIVHTEADFVAPIRLGDLIEVDLKVESIGTTSFTMETNFIKNGASMAKAKIVHVVYSRETEKSIPIPDEFKVHLVGNLVSRESF